MGKSLLLKVPVPCHENWNEMSPQDQGRFCLSCQKTVVDFTGMTDYELVQYFKNLNGNTCGRFSPNQLNKKYALESKRRLNWFKYFVHILIPTLLISARSYSQITVNNKVSTSITPTKKKKTPTMGCPAFRLPAQEISGKISNERGEVLAGASIYIKGTMEGLAADKDGSFVLTTKHNFPLTLIVSYVGYQPLEVLVEEKEIKNPLSIVLKESIMPEVVVNGYPIMGRLRSITTGSTSVIVSKCSGFQDLTKKIADTLWFLPGKTSFVRMYPNPLHKSSLLNIEFASAMKGDHTVMVTDLNGRRLQMEQFNVELANVKQQVRLKQNTVPGTYIITIINPNGKRLMSEKLVLMD